MSDIDEVKLELSGKTNFDEEHEGELFERISEVERQERAGDLVQGLSRGDCWLVVAMLAVFGVLPVIWYAVRYF
ncbi:hypothetical protein C2L80_04685 [Rubneribacter badeniensis]|uniref:Uncharacterized protein n=1 Tax=Rubneribacter badeniensis TaxID=2070688 RepID=A0A2K2U6D0_9ACTN|nr:hypothetical protein [Rubneribacter badeniensis]OUO90244.1 hypothetical protein B5F41_11660 [Gordonibacter sp. An232A]PNV65768.1 hypothetical protein C2L80_04685 [Rubneribacter badeniensis]